MAAHRKGVFYWTEELVNGITRCNVYHSTNPNPICHTRSPHTAQAICLALTATTAPPPESPTLFPQSKQGSQHWRI